MKLSSALRTLLFALLVPTALLAQTTATLTGVVTDPSGAVVPNASIQVTGIATGTTRAAVSDSAGIYIVPSLLPGAYKIAVTSTGSSLHRP